PAAKGSLSVAPATHSTAGDCRRARSSIRSEKSTPVTRPPARAAAIARSPVPQQASRTRSPGRTTSATVARRQRWSRPTVIARFIASYTGAIRSNIARTPSAGSLPDSTLMSALAPAAHQLVLEPQLVEAASDDEVDQVVHRACAVVEARREEEHDGAGLLHAEHVLEVDQREGRLARTEHEPPPLLERDARRPLDQVRHRPG